MKRKAVAIILSGVLLLSLGSCFRNTYQTGVAYDAYPPHEVPVYRDAVVFDCTEDAGRAVIRIAFGTDATVDEVARYYQDYYNNEQTALYTSYGTSGERMLSGTTAGGSAFFIDVRAAGSELSRYYETVSEITLAQHGGALLSKQTLTPAAALASGVLQYYPTGHAGYDAARLQALKRVEALSAQLLEQVDTMLVHNAALAEQFDAVWELPRADIPWPVLYNLRSAAVSHLQALSLRDSSDMRALPAELRQTAGPMYALRAAACLQDSTVHLLMAAGFGASLGETGDTALPDDLWNHVSAVWEEAEADFNALGVTAEKLDTLVLEMLAADRQICNEEMERLADNLAALRADTAAYIENNPDTDAAAVQELLDSFAVWLDDDADTQLTERTALNADDLFGQGCGLTGLSNVETTDQVAGNLKAAVDESNDNQTKPRHVRYSTAYRTAEAEGAIGLFLLIPLHDAFDETAQTPPSEPAQPVKPIEVPFPTTTGNARVDAFHTVMNATLEAAHERGNDPDFAAAVLSDEVTPDDLRDLTGSMVGGMELDMLLLAALSAAENRNNSAAAGQTGTISGDPELDRLLAICLTQTTAADKTSDTIDLGSPDDLPGRVKDLTDTICSDPVGRKLADSDVPASPESEADVNNALYVMTGSDERQNDAETASTVLAASLQTQVNTAAASKTRDGGDLFGTLTNMLGSSNTLKELQSMIIAQALGTALDDFSQALADDPEGAVNTALDRLIAQASGLSGFEQWAQLLQGLKDAVGNNLLWQALADAVTGDYTALLTLAIESSGQTPDASPDVPSSPPDDDVIPVEYDYSGFYALEFTLLDYVYEIQPYDPDNHMNSQPPFDITQSEWERRAEEEQTEQLQDPSFSYLTDKIQVWHEPGADAVYADMTLPVDIAYQTDYELEDGSGMVKSTIYFRPNEYSDGYGYISFVGGDNGSIEIIGEVTEYFEGGLNRLERHFRIDGVLITEEEYYSW